MTREDRERLLEIRKRGKMGRVPVSKEEHNFCTEMWMTNPKEYAEVEAEMTDWLLNRPWWEFV